MDIDKPGTSNARRLQGAMGVAESIEDHTIRFPVILNDQDVPEVIIDPGTILHFVSPSIFQGLKPKICGASGAIIHIADGSRRPLPDIVGTQVSDAGVLADMELHV